MTIDTIKEWLLINFEKGKFMHKLNNKIVVDRHKGIVTLTLETKENTYYIVATTNGYLGCTTSSRKPLPGEDWLRGSDLSDGDLTPETVQRIIFDILSCELDQE